MDHELRPEAAKHQVSLRLEKLRTLSYAQLSDLPPWSTEIMPFGNTKAQLTTYCEREQGDRLTIVVQFVPEGGVDGLIWHGVYAEGFWITAEGTILPLPDAQRFGFM